MIGESIDDQNIVLRSIHRNECIDDSIDWQKRYIDCELSLQRLASHSNKIRQIFINKISDLEKRLENALQRAQESELKYSSIMESLMEKNNRSKCDNNNESIVNESAPELHQLQHAMEQKEKVINELEIKIEEQKKLRLRDAKQVEQKAAKIKEWVATKLKELEEQNFCLREENRKCTQELIKLKKHLHNASPETRRKIEFVLNEYYDNKTSNLLMKDDLHEMVIKRNLKFLRPDCESSSSDEEAFDLNGVKHNSRKEKPIPPPRTRIPVAIGTNYTNICVTSPQTYNTRQHNSFFSRAGSLDRKLADMKKLNFSELKKKRTGVATNEMHDYSDIYTPSHELNPFLNANPCEVRPPTPPLHRCPSWESRIYQIASTGIKSATSTPTHSMRMIAKKRNTFLQKSSTVLNEYNVPVFATIKGRASRIRSIPFTDDSTDSSDNEIDPRITVTTITTGTTSSSGHESDIFGTHKRSFRREISAESQLSEDYALPPDAVMSASMDAIAITESSLEIMTPKRFSSLQRPSLVRDRFDNNNDNEILEKSGYLTKLGGRLKTWRRRWFVLKDGVLSYYKCQSDVNKCKPRAQIILDKSCRVSTAGDSGTFQLITGNNKKVYYLTADSVITLEEWIRILNSVLKRKAVFHIREDQKAIIEGYVVKVKSGHSKRCWCALYGSVLAYFKCSNETIPFNYLDLKGAKIEEVVNVSDSDNEDNTTTSLIETNTNRVSCEHTIAIFPKHISDPIYLLFSCKQEFNAWLYHLTVVLSGEHSAGTPFEHLVSRLMSAETECVDTLDGHSLWKNALLLYSKENICEPLTTLPNEYLKSEAIKLFKSIQLFISVPLDSSGIDYHICLVQNSLQLCLSHPELQSELYFQLIKQTSPHSHHKLCGSSGVHQFLLCAKQTMFSCDTSGTSSEKTSPTSMNDNMSSLNSMITCEKSNPSNYVFIQSFQFLSLAISLFVPQSRTLWLLKQHLRRSGDTKTEMGKYAIYCRRALEQTLLNGSRAYRPSRMEVLSILLRNPYHHSLPHSIPINLMNASYNVVGFDGSSSIKQFIQLLNTESGIRDNSQSGFALFSDDPIDKDVEHLLDCNSKLSDIISRWECVLRENHFGKFENTRVIKLIYKRRLFLRNHIKGETDKERILSVYEINNDIIGGRFPITQDLALELSALLAQIEFGDFVSINRTQIILQQVVERFFPTHLKEEILIKSLIELIRDKWMELRGRTTLDCVRIYLNCSRKWPFCGAKLFEAKLTKPLKIIDSLSPSFGIITSYTKLWIAVCDDSIALLDLESFHEIKRYSYKNLITFGGCKEDFMLVFTNKSYFIECDSGSGSSRANSIQSERLLFVMNKSKIVEITLLIADYINFDSSLNAVSTLDKSNETIDYSVDKYSISGGFSRGPSLKIITSVSHTKL